MSTLKNFNPIIEPTEENQEIDTLPRRLLERRMAVRRSCFKPKILCPDNITKLRKQDNNAHIILREGDRRRQQQRRNSRPSLLKADDIVILRKK